MELAPGEHTVMIRGEKVRIVIENDIVTVKDATTVVVEGGYNREAGTFQGSDGPSRFGLRLSRTEGGLYKALRIMFDVDKSEIANTEVVPGRRQVQILTNTTHGRPGGACSIAYFEQPQD